MYLEKMETERAILLILQLGMPLKEESLTYIQHIILK